MVPVQTGASLSLSLASVREKSIMLDTNMSDIFWVVGSTPLSVVNCARVYFMSYESKFTHTRRVMWYFFIQRLQRSNFNILAS